MRDGAGIEEGRASGSRRLSTNRTRINEWVDRQIGRQVKMMARALGRLMGRFVFVVRQISWSDVLVVGGSVSLYYGLALISRAWAFVVIGIIWMVIGLAAAWRKGG